MNRFHGGNVCEIGRSRHIPPEAIEDYSANINPLGPPPGAEEAVARAFARMAPYPDIQSAGLREALSAYEGVPPEWVFPGNGAAGALFILVRAASPKCAAVLGPAFSEYREACESVGCRVEDLLAPEEKDFSPRELAVRAPPEAGAVFLCNPCNPTGALWERAEIERLASSAAGRLCVVDESFLDFREDREARTAVPLLAKYRNLAVLKSLTKFYAMAGARIGYVLCKDSGLLQKMERVSPPWQVNVFAEELTLSALKDAAYQERTRGFVSRQAASLYQALSEIPGIKPYPPGANFILFQAQRTDLKETLLSRGLLIRSCGDFPGLSERFYRVCVSGPEKNQRLVDVLSDILYKKENIT